MVPAVSLFRWVGAPAGPNASIDRHGPWRRDERRMVDGTMTADGWIRNGAVSEVECKARPNTVHLSIDMGSNLPIFISGATYGQDCRTT
jgi:hypothetical protein